MTSHIFFFTSSRKADKVSIITIMCRDLVKATVLASRYFDKQGYKGKPKVLAI